MAATVSSQLRLSARFVPEISSSVRTASLRQPMRMQRRMLVRCEAEPTNNASQSPALATPIVEKTPKATAPPGLASRGPVTVFDVMAFGSVGPEVINGRLAMVGFIAALVVEASTGASLTAQLGNSVSIAWSVFVISLLSAASLIPLFKGITPQSRSDGVFTSSAETWNGRAAMLGLVALAITEYVQGKSFI